MTGIERLCELAGGIRCTIKLYGVTSFDYDAEHGLSRSDFGGYLRDLIADIADQIEREHAEDCFRMGEQLGADGSRLDAEQALCVEVGAPMDEGADPLDVLRRHVGCLSDTVENLRLELGEQSDAAAWVRAHGGLGAVKKRLDWVVGHCSTDQQLDFDFWLSGRVMYALGFDEDMADRDEVECRLTARLMPEGMEWLVEAWPRFEDDSPVKFGEEAMGFSHKPPFIIDHITLFDGGEATVCAEADLNSDTIKNFVRVRPGKRVKRPAPKVLDADGVEIREKRDAWWICEGDERGVHAERLRVETIGPNGLIECSPYNGGTWVYLEPSELYVNKPVPASDGKPLREGETVWHRQTGRAATVKGFDRMLGEPCAVIDFAGIEQRVRGELLTHERPESWERLEKDAYKATCAYFGTSMIDCEECKHESSTCALDKARDLVRRARALAERDA